jgi:hypothetical protein
MGSIITSCMNVVRHLPQGSAVDIPWEWMEQHKVTESSVIYPLDFTNEDKIKQTVSRLFFAIVLPNFAKPLGYANLGLGTVHLLWCVINIRKIRDKTEGYSSKEVENALIRMCTGVYDLAIAYLIYSSFMSSIWGRSTILLAFALVPAYPIQLHHMIFEKGTKQIAGEPKEVEVPQPKEEIDHCDLRVGCLIKQICSGLVETFIPEPAPLPKSLSQRAMSLPNALGTWGRSSYASLRGFPRDDGKPK